MNRLIASACGVALIVSTSATPSSSAEGVLRLAKTKVSGCMKFVNPKGKNWKALGMIGVSGASCPAELNGVQTIQAKMVDAHQVSLANGMTCTFDDAGKGRCR